MPFIKFFWKDFKSDRSFNWFYVLCLTLGIIGLLLVESFRVGIEEKVSKNAKNFIASDLSISSRRALLDTEISGIEGHLAEKKYTYANSPTGASPSNLICPYGIFRLIFLVFFG